jgi:REP element-mobilizing transposase RayT
MTIFQDDQDRRRFVEILIEEKERHGVDILAECEMRNHFHLVVGTPHGNLSTFMEQFEGRFARYSNWRHGNVGHLFQGRFHDVAIEHDIHLLIALCYVFLNPVAARLVTRAEDYEWSTYAATVALAALPSYLSLQWMTALFPSESLRESQRRLRHLLSEAKPVDAYLQDEGTYVAPGAVRRVLRSYVGEQLQVGLLPCMYRSALRLQLPELVQPGLSGRPRAAAIYDAHVLHGYTLAAIARELRLDQSTVSKDFRSFCR